jgi:LPXTG-motif cell wall-anchored protein
MDALATYIEDESIDANYYADNDSGSTEITITDDTDIGWYFIACTDDNSGNAGLISTLNTTRSHFANVTADGLTINPKVDVPSITKGVSTTAGGTFGESINASVGDELFFELKATVPNLVTFGDMSSFDYIYKITDTLTNLTMEDVSGVAINWYDKDGNNETELTGSGTNYTATYASGVLTIEFVSDYIEGLTTTTDPADLFGYFIITYSATLTADAAAVSGSILAGGSNSAVLEYGNDPTNDSNTAETPAAVTDIYTYGFIIFKYETVSSPGNETALAGAEFSLYSEDPSMGSPSPIKFSQDASGYYYPDEDSGEESFISPADGEIELRGLAAGEYWLAEVTPPAGYALLETPVKVVVIDDGSDGDWEVKLDNISGSALTDNTVEVENGEGNLFPSTGGTGTIILYCVGGALMVGAFALLLLRRRRT